MNFNEKRCVCKLYFFFSIFILFRSFSSSFTFCLALNFSCSHHRWKYTVVVIAVFRFHMLQHFGFYLFGGNELRQQARCVIWYCWAFDRSAFVSISCKSNFHHSNFNFWRKIFCKWISDFGDAQWNLIYLFFYLLYFISIDSWIENKMNE